MKQPNVSCMKPTSDDWHPCYEGNQVRVYIGQASPETDSFFVGACGADDEYWACEQTCIMEASIMYMRVTSLDDVTKDALALLGFKRS